MRIIAGEFRGRRLHAPKSDRIRPTGDRVREAVFSIIASAIPDARVLDLFAGTGAMGLEALSRGAAQCVFVDQGVEAARLIRENIELCGASDYSFLVQDAVPSALRRLAEKGEFFDLIFMDPPYGKGLVEKTLEIVGAVSTAETLVLAEHHIRDDSPDLVKDWKKDSERRYGDTMISIYSILK